MRSLVGKSLVASAFTLAAAGCAGPIGSPVDAAPASLRPDASESLVQVVAARGVQIYRCAANNEWTFVAPEADLFDAGGKLVGKHYAGPHWEMNDGSRVLGKVKARADAPIPGAIPWLLMEAKNVGADEKFSRYSSVQRLQTVGGVAPQGGCAQSNLGATVRVPYEANYSFWARRDY